MPRLEIELCEERLCTPKHPHVLYDASPNNPTYERLAEDGRRDVL